ncbi:MULTISPECIES: hypothetical protein [Yersinia]|uniref:hypothetical protein n=1 Tax=Yersinia TaxID=629 RepID=UPI000B412C6D|nr:hypothetical protein [Yersinia intermedia]OVZ77657.1 hypothetical protein CBW55_02360 [Yersinia intermedia]
MKMVSYWKSPEKFHEDDGMVLIYGYYDHKHEYNGGTKELGVHWDGYPQSRGILSPCVIPENSRNAMLSGLLHQAVSSGNKLMMNDISKAIEFFNT